MNNIVCYGEVLWDVFPTHKKIGGAPLNVAYRLRSFDNQVSMISAVGNDDYGKTLISYLEDNNINTDCIQVLEDYSTGKVKVKLDQKGSATYTIEHPSAWDKISLEETAISVVKNANAFIFGSLVARDNVSRETLFELIDFAKYRVFDVNLRPPHYDLKVLEKLMNNADFIKFNDDELYEICQSLGSRFNGLEQNLKFIAEKTNTKHICVTKGQHGAVLLYNKNLYYNSGYIIKVVDTVGAGDSFLGSLISQLLSQVEPQKAIDFACAVGALVAQNEGANPNISDAEIKSFMNLD
ncbi:carbohydrate kinase family protein [Flavobacteriaceae bacterium 14752]|uniref:carbohydrate kinase family protein n=1 Tax=Mesohalobacter salilacus TaxID=2491711 RepID=UPI000F6364B9|nr:carbohydrate kinase [Flavobacteriaceae bacterium 14752]